MLPISLALVAGERGNGLVGLGVGGLVVAFWSLVAARHNRGIAADLAAGEKCRVVGLCERKIKLEPRKDDGRETREPICLLVANGRQFEVAEAIWDEAQEGCLMTVDVGAISGTVISVDIVRVDG